jgi:hypothetical protein
MLKRSTVLALGFTLLAAPSFVAGGAAPANAFWQPPPGPPGPVGGSGKPDLVPMSPPNSLYFCKSDGGQLKPTVRVFNQGNAYAPASITTVSFYSFGQRSVPTVGILAGKYVDLVIDPPNGCFDPDCVFNITVGGNHSLDESNYGNNSAFGQCIG